MKEKEKKGVEILQWWLHFKRLYKNGKRKGTSSNEKNICCYSQPVENWVGICKLSYISTRSSFVLSGNDFYMIGEKTQYMYSLRKKVRIKKIGKLESISALATEF